MPDRIREINDRFIEKVGIETTGNAYAKSQIIILDNNKEPYDVGIYRADEYLFERTDWANAGINTVVDAYQERVDRGCRTDLFWRLIGITTSIEQSGGGPNQGVTTSLVTNYTIQCEQLNPAGYQPAGVPFPPQVPGEDPEPLVFDPNRLYVMNQNSQNAVLSGFTTYPLDTKFGLTPTEGDNYHTWKVKEEPYSEDLVDPILATGVGTMQLATNVLTFETLQPIDEEKPEIPGIKEGAIITCDSDGIWFNNNTSIVSFGTTIVGLGTTNVAGVSTTKGTARKTYVETSDFAMRDVNVPEFNGTFTNFFILLGPQDINYDKLALKRTSEDIDELSPYTPQRICPMTPSLIGKGVEIDYSNTGYSNSCQEWNKFLEGQPNPADPIEINNDADFTLKIVREPRVGGGRVWYNQAFQYFPLLANGNYAERGNIRVLNRIGSTAGIPSPPLPTHTIYSSSFPNGNCPNLDQEISDREDDRDDIEDQLGSDLNDSDSKLFKLYSLTNALRLERNELNLRIWAFRIQMGTGEENVSKWDERLLIINDPDFYDLLQDPLTDAERNRFAQKRFPTQ